MLTSKITANNPEGGAACPPSSANGIPLIERAWRAISNGRSVLLLKYARILPCNANPKLSQKAKKTKQIQHRFFG